MSYLTGPSLADDDRFIELFREAERRREINWQFIRGAAICISAAIVLWTLIIWAFLALFNDLNAHDIRIGGGIIAASLAVLFAVAAREWGKR